MKDYFTDLAVVHNRSLDIPDSGKPQGSYPDLQALSELASDNAVSIAVTPEAAIISGSMDLIKESIRCYTDYAKCREVEETERFRIKSHLVAVTKRMEARKEVVLKTLEYNHEEKMQLYKKLSEAILRATEDQQYDILVLVANTMLNVFNKPIEIPNLDTIK